MAILWFANFDPFYLNKSLCIHAFIFWSQIVLQRWTDRHFATSKLVEESLSHIHTRPEEFNSNEIQLPARLSCLVSPIHGVHTNPWCSAYRLPVDFPCLHSLLSRFTVQKTFSHLLVLNHKQWNRLKKVFSNMLSQSVIFLFKDV